MDRAGQLELSFRSWGGRRAGAGRPRGTHSGVPHARRPRHDRHHPVHVTWRVGPGIPNLRQKAPFRTVRRCIEAARERHGARIVQFSVQSNHLHFIVEANGRTELLTALRGLGIRIARALNGALARRGRVLSDRYHARALTTPRAVRAALRYVLSNSRHHAAGAAPCGVLDGCSSAPWFQGWIHPDAVRRAFVLPRAGPESATVPVAEARTWLLTIGWKRHGLIDPDETPGGTRRTRRRAR